MFFWGLKWQKKKKFVWFYIPDAMCEEQTKHLPKVYILTDLFSSQNCGDWFVHELDWSGILQTNHLDGFYDILMALFYHFFELDFHWWRNNQSPVFLVNGWTEDAAPVLLVQACLVRNTHICTCSMGKSLYTYAWQTCTTGPAE